MKTSLKRNFGYQTAYQILTLILPLITAPFLSRVLGADNLGIFAFTSSLVSYFVLFAILGTNNYGTREIAVCGENRELRSRKFFSIYLFEFIFTIAAIIAYIIYIIIFRPLNLMITAIQGALLLASLLDINWLFFGVEDFKTTITRNFCIKLISFALIIILVRNKNDLWIYTAIMAGSTFVSNAYLWFVSTKYIDFRFAKYISLTDVLSHAKGNFMLFVPLMAMSIYHAMDKTMLGLMSTYTQTGFYYNADKIISAPVGLINGFCTVMLPRMSSLIGNGREEEAHMYLRDSIKVMAVMTFSVACGAVSISKEFTPVFFGTGYEPCSQLIMLLSPIIPIKGYCYLARILYLIPSNLEKIYISSVTAGAIMNLFVNWMLIPEYGAVGACIGTVSAELVSCVYQYIVMNKYLPVLKDVLYSFVYLVIGFIMIFCVRAISAIMPANIAGLLGEIAAGAALYSIICIAYWHFSKNEMYISIKESMKSKRVRK